MEQFEPITSLLFVDVDCDIDFNIDVDVDVVEIDGVCSASALPLCWCGRVFGPLWLLDEKDGSDIRRTSRVPDALGPLLKSDLVFQITGTTSRMTCLCWHSFLRRQYGSKK